MKKLETFYFTFGTDQRFPFYMGWVEIQAVDEGSARRIFREYFPGDGPYLNCAFVYSEPEFKKTVMYRGDYGDRCHARIGLTEVDDRR